jgi:peroxiredoxin
MNINQPVPNFSLPNLDGNVINIQNYHGKIVIINFWSCECPHSERTDKAIMAMFMQHLHRAADAVQVWQDEVVMFSIASNRNESIEDLKNVSTARRIPHVLLDAECQVANLFEAVTTPHIFVIDKNGTLAYQGAVDDVKFRQKTPTRFYLDEAIESLLAGRVPEIQESSAYGCAIVREI